MPDNVGAMWAEAGVVALPCCARYSGALRLVSGFVVKRTSVAPALGRCLSSFRQAFVGLALFASGTGCAPELLSAQIAPSCRIHRLREVAVVGSRDRLGYALTSVPTADMSKDGRLFVLQPQESEVKVFDPQGSRISTIGRRGSGPGELMLPTSMGIRGDSLWVADMQQSRLSWFNLDGDLLSDVRLSVFAYGPNMFPVGPGEPLVDGTFLARPAGRFVPGDNTVGEMLPPMPLLKLSREGRNMDTVVVVGPSRRPSGVIQRIVDGQPWQTQFRQFFNDAHFILLSNDGASVVVIERPAARSGAVSAYTVTRVNIHGDTVFRATLRYTPRPLTAAEVDSVVSQRLPPPDRTPMGLTPERLRRELERALYRPEYHPPVRSAFTDHEGRIWLGLAQPRLAYAVWQVLDSLGRPEAAVLADPGVTLMGAGSARVWGVRTDELDVPYVVVYELEDMAEQLGNLGLDAVCGLQSST